MFTNSKQTPITKPFNFKETIIKYAYHWPFFVLGLIFTFLAAYLYVQITNPVYVVKASLMVKDDEKNPHEKSALYEIDLSENHKVAENEIGVLQSRTLMNQVVKDLQLWITYTTKTGLSNEDLYISSPVKFELIGIHSQRDLEKKKIEVKIKDRNSFYLKMPDGKFKIFDFKNNLVNNFGTWRLTPNTNLLNYQGSVITISLSDPNRVSNQYQKDIDITLLDKKAPTIGLSVKDQVPDRGADILNDLIKVYNEASITESDRATQSTLNFINQRLASLTGEVSNAEKNVEGYRSSQGLTDITSQSQAYLQSVHTNDASLSEVNVQLNIITGIENYINSVQNAENPPAVLGIDDVGLRSLIETLAGLQLQRVKMLANSPENNPTVITVNKQIASTKAAIKNNVAMIKSSLLEKKRAIQAFSDKYENSIKNIPRQEREYVDLKRYQNVKQTLYDYLLQKKEEISLSYVSAVADARIVDNAYTGEVQWPKKSIIYGIALLFGITLPAGFIYSKEIIQNRITSLSDIKDVVDTPVIGELSFVKTKNHIIIQDRKNIAIVEQFRMLRTNLFQVFENKESGRKTLITSSVSGEGKSFISTNLAISLASSGRKTIILEMDLRKPKISQILGLPADHLGLSNYLTKRAPIQDIIQVSELIDDLYVIGCGSVLHDAPAELFERKELAELMRALEKDYDDIIIDSPPLHLVTDAMILSKFADITLYIIRQGYTGKSELTFINDLYTNQKLPNMNIVLNGIQRTKYGYGYKYDNSYYN
jgi:tyrosine-protein kinase Etk/Wzc